MMQHTPQDDGLHMPAEWAPHAGCWMAWPKRAALWGDGFDAACNAYAAVAHAIAAFEPVWMISDDARAAAAYCGADIEIVEMPQDDSWTRDTGPSFVVDLVGKVAGVDWRFNGWGGVYPDHEKDDAMAGAVLARLGMRRYRAPFVLEGGAVHVDGEGCVLATEQCLLSRNPGMTRAQIEEGLRAYLGASEIIWLGEGLTEDETAGHIDNVACFARPGAVVVLEESDAGDANFAVLKENIRRLGEARDARGRPLEIVALPQPARRAGPGGRLSLSYVNYYLAEGAVIMPGFDDPADEAARDILSATFPGREVVQLDALAIVQGGGGIHCITQQQPKGLPLV